MRLFAFRSTNIPASQALCNISSLFDSTDAIIPPSLQVESQRLTIDILNVDIRTLADSLKDVKSELVSCSNHVSRVACSSLCSSPVVTDLAVSFPSRLASSPRRRKRVVLSKVPLMMFKSPSPAQALNATFPRSKWVNFSFDSAGFRRCSSLSNELTPYSPSSQPECVDLENLRLHRSVKKTKKSLAASRTELSACRAEVSLQCFLLHFAIP